MLNLSIISLKLNGKDMQIRELDLKELDDAYMLISKCYTQLSYKEFEDLIYDMRHMDYKIIGIFEREILVSYAGVCIQTTLKDKRHLKVFDFFSDENYDTQRYDKIMIDYLNDYAKIGMCKKVIFTK